MKNLDLNAYGVQELNQQEMINVEGGGWLSNIGNAIIGAIDSAIGWLGESLGDFGRWVEENGDKLLPCWKF